MFGSMVLEVAIGLVFVYLLLSLVVTAITELISGWRKWRAQNLWAGVRNLLDSGEAEEWVTKLYDHPLIQSLSPSTKSGKKGPSYIPSRTFAVALLETLKDGEPAGRLAVQGIRRVLATTPDSASLTDLQAGLRDAIKDLPDTGAIGALKVEILTLIGRIPATASLVDAKSAINNWLGRLPDRWLPMLIENMPDSKLKKTLSALADESHLGAEHLKENIEIWFNNSMERVSGWYKRKTQLVHILLALGVSLVINVDSVLVVNALSQNQALRESVVAEADAYAKQQAAQASAPGQPQAPPTPATTPSVLERLRAQISQLDLPIGWVLPGQRGFDPANRDYRGWPGWRRYGTWTQWGTLWMQTIRFHLLGWLLTAFAISLGAPFWFDILNKVINIRSSGKAPEEKPKSPQVVPQPVEPGQTPAVPR